MHVVKVIFFGSILGLLLSCASTPDKSENHAENKEAENQKEPTAQERIYQAKFSGAFYDRF